MSELNKSQVLYLVTGEDGFGADFIKKLNKAVVEAAQSLNCLPDENWFFKIPLGRPDPIPVEILNSCRSAMGQAGFSTGPFLENLSITTETLDTAEGLKKCAAEAGLDDFQVGDDPSVSVSENMAPDSESSFSPVGLPGSAAGAGALLMLSAVRPHPFLGMGAAMFNLGCGVLDRETKLRLHRPVKPVVDTPLCAGCGSCLGACIFDAISFSGGRASIDHKLCVGCGECMGACHLGGIGPENGMDIARYQKMVAEAGAAVFKKSQAGRNKSLLFINFLMPLPRQAGGSLGRDRFLKGNYGALLSTDPVALDQATWDILVQGAVHGLRQWSGFLQEPTPLMQRAEALKTGSRLYHLSTQN